GSENSAAQARAAVDELSHRFRVDPEFGPKIREVRTRLEKLDSDGRNLKTGPGGLYDIDYMCGYLLVQHGMEDVRKDVRQTIASLHARGLLSIPDAQGLDSASELLRAVEHAIRLVLGKARKALPASGNMRQAVEDLTFASLNDSFSGHRDLSAVMQRAFLTVREIYARIVA
ncbi:MAG TPA: hypothetical protein VFM10_04690, partial [Terriglobales bacterium]|nr:hypothetical protein [Terriglobales bacterium]